jgi:hypothetical protein
MLFYDQIRFCYVGEENLLLLLLITKILPFKLRPLKFANLNLVSLFSCRVYLSENYKDIPYFEHIDGNFHFVISLGESAVKIPLHPDQQGEIGFPESIVFKANEHEKDDQKIIAKYVKETAPTTTYRIQSQTSIELLNGK